jgi:hypothetical protein
MATPERTVRLDLTHDKLHALSWAVWFAQPAATSQDQAALDELSAELVRKRRSILTPGRSANAAEPQPDPEPEPQRKLGDDAGPR